MNLFLRRHWLKTAQAAWVLITLLTILLYAFSVSASLIDLQRNCPTSACVSLQKDPQAVKELRSLGISGRFVIAYFNATDILTVLVFLTVGIFLFLRKRQDGMSLLVSLTLILFGVVTASGSFDDVSKYDPALIIPNLFVQACNGTCYALFFYLFPNGRFVPGWTRWAMIPVLGLTVFHVLQPNSPINGLAFLVGCITFLIAQLYRYQRVSNLIQRQQTKWVLYAAIISVVAPLALSEIINLLYGTSGGFHQPGILASMLINGAFHFSLALLPLSMAVAILRYHLFDIDILIRRTLIYGALTALLALIYFGCVIGLQQIFRALTGERSDLAIILSTLAIVALFNPLRLRIQNVIDLRFYRRRYDAGRALASFSAVTRREVDLNALTWQLLQIVDETMQPAKAQLWLKRTTIYKVNSIARK